jgi:O-methyltransferase
MYIDLLKNCLLDLHRANQTEYKPIQKKKTSAIRGFLLACNKLLARKRMIICEIKEYNENARINGLDWPMYADSMIGLKRMDNLEFCVTKVLEENIPGDFIETGVWRGGSCIFMAGLLKDKNISNRNIWVADSFEGLPKPNEEKYAADKGDNHHIFSELAVSLETVKDNFNKYGLLGDNIKFLKGWFKDTLPVAPIEKLAVLRLDGDMYESTMDGLVNLYPKLSAGGYCIVDDWGAVEGCKKAIVDYRSQHNITDEIIDIDGSGVYWKKL